MANALSQPKRRCDGRSENTVTANPHASTTKVRITAGPTSTVARSTATARSSAGLSSRRRRLRKWIVALNPSPNETVNPTMLANCRPCPVAWRIAPDATQGIFPANGRKHYNEGTESGSHKGSDKEELKRQPNTQFSDHRGAIARGNYGKAGYRYAESRIVGAHLGKRVFERLDDRQKLASVGIRYPPGHNDGVLLGGNKSQREIARQYFDILFQCADGRHASLNEPAPQFLERPGRRVRRGHGELGGLPDDGVQAATALLRQYLRAHATGCPTASLRPSSPRTHP
jgi:hypothetical protein